MTAQPTPMTPVSFEALDIDALATATGRVAVVLEADGKMDAAGRRINKLTRGALARLAAGKDAPPDGAGRPQGRRRAGQGARHG